MLVTTTPPVLHLRGASFGYAERTVVRDVDLDLRQGEVVALLGPNGSGKSTLVRGLLGLNEHVGGTVQVLGEDLDRLTRRSRVGYVPQRHTLSGSVRATVEEVVSVGRLPQQPWWRRLDRSDRAAVHEALRLVGLSDRASEDVSTLSGGQQRRVLIARALAGQPELLLMDEPTAGVDEASQYALADVLARLVDHGTTMLVVTHEIAALHGVVSRIVELSSGRVHFDGSPAAYAEHQAHEILGGHAHEPPVGPRAHLPVSGPLTTESPLA